MREGAALALTFGLFQAGMALSGWGLGRILGTWLGGWNHWLAALLLLGLGAKMIWEAFGADGDLDEAGALQFVTLLVLAFATSVDAFAAGVSLPTLELPIAASVLAIGLVTIVMSATGYALGRRIGSMIGPRLDLLGGAVLIALGLKVLIEQVG